MLTGQKAYCIINKILNLENLYLANISLESYFNWTEWTRKLQNHPAAHLVIDESLPMDMICEEKDFGKKY